MSSSMGARSYSTSSFSTLPTVQTEGEKELKPCEKITISNHNMNNNLQPLQSQTGGVSPDYRALLLMKRTQFKRAWRFSEEDDSDETDTSSSEDEDGKKIEDGNNLPTNSRYPVSEVTSFSDESSTSSEVTDYDVVCKGSCGFSPQTTPHVCVRPTDSHAVLKISIPEQKLTKCLQVKATETVWIAKQRVIQTLAKKLLDALNYGFYCKKQGIFLLEHKPVSHYVEAKCVGSYELRYKRRVFNLLTRSPQESRRLLKMQSDVKRKELMRYVKQNNAEKISQLLKNGIDPNYHMQSDGETPLTTAVAISSHVSHGVWVSSPAIMALLNGDAHLDFRNRQGFTPLHVAVKAGNVNVLKTLLDVGAPPNAVDGNDLTPLYHCALLDTTADCIQPLYRAGANLSCVNSQKWTILHQVCRYGRLAHLNAILEILTSSRECEGLVNAQNESGNTALHLCAISNHPKCLLTLLKHGADVTLRNFSHQDPFEVAAVTQNMNVANLIKDFSNLSDQEISCLIEDSSASQDSLKSADDQLGNRRHTLTAVTFNKVSSSLSQTLHRKNPFAKEKSRSKHSKHLPLSATLPRNLAVAHSLSSSKDVVHGVAGRDKTCSLSSASSHEEIVSYIACKDYKATNSDEVSLRKGQAVTAVSFDTSCQGIPEGFCKGQVGERTGLLPIACLQAFQLRKPLLETSSPMAERKAALSESTRKSNENSMLARSHVDDMRNEVVDVALQSTSHPDVFHRCRDVTLSRGPDGYGFVLRGAKSDAPIESFSATARHPGLQYLESVEDGSRAHRAGLRAGDFILKINTTDVSCMGHKQAVEVIKKIRDPIRLRIVSVVIKSKESAAEDCNASAKLSTSSTSDVAMTSSRIPTSPFEKLSRSGSVRSAIGQLDSVLAMEDLSDDATDEATTATLRRRPVSRKFRSQDLQEIFLRQGVHNQDSSQSPKESQTFSAAMSRRLTRVLPPTLPQSTSLPVDEISQNGGAFPISTLGRSNSFTGNAVCTVTGLTAVTTTTVQSYGDGNFQTGVSHVTSVPASGKKPPPPPQRKTSRLTNLEENKKLATANSPQPLIQASPVSPTSKSFGRKLANQDKVDLFDFAAAVANHAQQRRERVSSSEGQQRVASVPVAHNVASKPPPTIAPKPSRVKSDPVSPKMNDNSSSAFVLAMAAKKASLRHRSQIEPVATDVACKPRFKSNPTKHTTITEDRATGAKEIGDITHLPPPPASAVSYDFPLPPPPPISNQGFDHSMTFDPMVLPPPPDAMLISPPANFAGGSNISKVHEFPSTVLPPSRFKDGSSAADRPISVSSNGLDNVSNADSGVDDIGPNHRHQHSETRTNLETLSVVSSLSTVSSDEGSDIGVSMSYDPKATPDHSTGNIYLDALKKNRSANVTSSDSSSIVLTKVSFTPSKSMQSLTELTKPPAFTPPSVNATKAAPLPSNSTNISGQSIEAKPLAQWTVEDVTKWLEGLGLDMYAQVFVENEIVGSHLPDLGKEDLQELGVTRVGHRLTIERSLKKLLDK